MRALVTGAGGFIGSTLAESLLTEGNTVVGVDCFTDYYEPATKKHHVELLLEHEQFSFFHADLREAPLDPLMDVDVIFHLAAQPGVRRSWDEFETYLHDNVLVTQRLLEACRRAPHLQRIVYASSSSVYGDSQRYPTREDDPLHPHSPYGVTKLSAEQLCVAYAENFQLPTISLRYFTVYGPRQRPDMAFHRMCAAILEGETFPLFGDGSARRNFTYVDDVVRATTLAGLADTAPGTILNVAGTTDVTMTQTVELLNEIAGRRLRLDLQASHPGDVRRTGGSIDRAAALLGWEPQVDLPTGLRAQFDWHCSQHG